MRYLFERRFNALDGFVLPVTAMLLHDGYYLVGGASLIVGLLISCAGEAFLIARATRQGSGT